MHWCSGTVQSDALQLSPRILAASLIGSPWYSPISGPPPRSGRVLVLPRGPSAFEIDLRGGRCNARDDP